ncbi:MAG: AsmA protein [Halioglobus sp.]
MARFVVILIAVPLILLVAAALLLPLLVSERQVLDLASKAIKEKTGATLVVNGDANFSIFPSIAVDLGDAVIEFPGEQSISATARSLAIGLELWPVFSGNAEVEEIIVDGLMMSVRSAPAAPAQDTSELSDAQLDAYYPERRLEIEKGEELQGGKSILAIPLALNVQRLLLSDSVLETISYETGERSSVEITKLEAIDLNLDNQPIRIELRALLGLDEDATPIAVSASGKIQVDSQSHLLTLGSLAVSISGALESSLSLKAQGEVDLVKQVADLQVEIALGDTLGEGSLRYASFESPQIEAKLHLNQFDPALLALAVPKATATHKTDSNAVPSNSGSPKPTAGEQAFPLDVIRAIDTRAALSIDKAVFAGHILENVNVKLRALEGVVKLNRLTGRLHGGKLDMTAIFDAKHNNATLSTSGGLSGMQISKALEAVNAAPIANGEADLEWALKSSGRTSNQLIEVMTGPINVITRKAELGNMGVEKMLCEAVALSNREVLAAELPESTQFEALSLQMKVSDGTLQMSSLLAELEHLKLSGSGSLKFLSQEFEATFSAALSEDLATVDPACRINKRLSGILWPVNCAGIITGDPGKWCSVDSQKIIKQMATQEVERKIEKEAGRLFDKFLKRHTSQ